MFTKKKDKEYELFMISGVKDFIGDIEGCKIEKSNTVSELAKIFPNAKKKALKNHIHKIRLKKV